jgi:hypothetical protein
VVRGDGGLSGYRWGTTRKAELLRRERAEDDCGADGEGGVEGDAGARGGLGSGGAGPGAA